MLKRKSAELGDREFCKKISEWFYKLIWKKWLNIFSLYLAKNKDNYNFEFHSAMEQFARQWDVEKQSGCDSQSDLVLEDAKRIIDVINASELLKECGHKLQIMFDKFDTNDSITSDEKNNFLKQNDELESTIKGIINGDFNIRQQSERELRIVLHNNSDSFSINSDNWYNIKSTQGSSKKQISWKFEIIRIFVIGLLMDDISYLKISRDDPRVNDNLNKIRTFFYKYGGKEKLKDAQEIIYQIIGGSVLKNSKGLNKLLFQTLLFIGVLGLYQDMKSIEDLWNTGYRPALLLFGNTKPVSDLEKKFVSLDEIGEKILFLIKHLFEI